MKKHVSILLAVVTAMVVTSVEARAAENFTQADAAGTLTYAYEGSQLGQTVASGDFNGDGYADLAVGAPETSSDGFTSNGAIYIINGGSDTRLSSSVAIEGSESFAADVTLHGVSNSDSIGTSAMRACHLRSAEASDLIFLSNGDVHILYALSNEWTSVSDSVGLTGSASEVECGDVNNDGYDDLIVSSAADELYVVYGDHFGEGTELVSGTVASLADVTITQEAEGGQFGFDNIAVGDLNGDGYDDVIASDRSNNSDGDSTGAVYIFYGDSLASGVNSTVGVEITGSASGSQFGYYLASGDLNGDGYAEFSVRSPISSTTYLIFAGSTTKFTSGEFTGKYSTTLTSFKYQTVSVVDINGDGVKDLVAGDYSTTTVNDPMYVIYGTTGTLPSGSISSSSVYDVRIVDNSQVYSSFARSYVFADLNGDSYLELYAGAFTADIATTEDGQLYVFELGVDADHDGVLSADGLLLSGTDCDDSDAAASESATYYADIDQDGLGDAASTTTTCVGSTPDGYVTDFTDTNDNDFDNDGVAGATWSGTDCNDADATLTTEVTYYDDTDGDGLGDPAVTTSICALTAPEGYVDNALDTDPTPDDTPADSGEDTSTGDGTSTEDTIDTGDVTDPVDTGTVTDENTDTTTDTGGTDATTDTESDPVSTDTVTDATVSDVTPNSQGAMTVTYSDNSTVSVAVFPAFTGSALVKVQVYPDSDYVLVLHPRGKKIALVNVATGEVVQRIQLSKKIRYAKNALKLLDVRHDGSIDAVVTSRTKGNGRVSLLQVNTTTGHMALKDAKVLRGAAKVVVQKTKAPKKTIVLRGRSGKILRTFAVRTAYTLAVK